ncbi:MAG: ribonuclease HII [Patescibacteria group bacterium]
MVLPTLKVEKSLWKKGLANVVGIDEVGRGSWAGPLVAAGVILPKNFIAPKNFADSKQISLTLRTQFDKFIRQQAKCVAVAEISHTTINKIGVGIANQMAFRKVLKLLAIPADFVLVDAFHIKYLAKSAQNPIKHGDQLVTSIAAASIVAKVYRDNLMQGLAQSFPKYGFEKHKGYGTKIHQEAIQKYGFCRIHRVNYNLNFLFT